MWTLPPAQLPALMAIIPPMLVSVRVAPCLSLSEDGCSEMDLK